MIRTHLCHGVGDGCERCEAERSEFSPLPKVRCNSCFELMRSIARLQAAGSAALPYLRRLGTPDEVLSAMESALKGETSTES